MIQYTIVRMDTDAHEFHVRLSMSRDRRERTLLTLPAWIPGSYMIRDFARNVTSLKCTGDERALDAVKRDKQSWEICEGTDDLVVEYSVYAFDLSVRSAYLDRTRGYFNGTCLFLWPDGVTDVQWCVDIPRVGVVAGDWRVATTLPVEQVDDAGFGSYQGSGRDLLYDCPVEIAAFERAAFFVRGIAHEFAVTDGGRFDLARVTDDVSRVCSEHAAMFGELPVSRYLFQTLATADGYGGLEHRDSTSLICKRSDLPRHGLGQADKGYRQFLGLCSHEYFHLWNVKRIRPRRLADSDLSSEAYTELLWAFEGITSYYDELALARSGVLPRDAYLDLFATTVSRVLRAPGRHRQSVAESSFDAWTKFYKQDENAPNAIVSYYAKGALVAFGLDTEIRVLSDGELSLDDLMRSLWLEHGRTDTGVSERGIERIVARLLGRSCDDFFDRYVYGTDELPLREWFARVGVGYRVRPAGSSEDQGGYREDAPKGSVPPTLGARYRAQGEGLRIVNVLTGSAAQKAGLAAGDLLLAIDGERATQGNIGDLLSRVAGGFVDVHYFRRDRLLTASLPIEAPADDTCDLWWLGDEESKPGAHAHRDAWMRSNQVDSD